MPDRPITIPAYNLRTCPINLMNIFHIYQVTYMASLHIIFNPKKSVSSLDANCFARRNTFFQMLIRTPCSSRWYHSISHTSINIIFTRTNVRNMKKTARLQEQSSIFLHPTYSFPSSIQRTQRLSPQIISICCLIR